MKVSCFEQSCDSMMNGIDHLQQQDHDSLRLFFLLCGSICHFCVNKLTEACFGMAITSQKLLRFRLDSFCLFNTFCYQKNYFLSTHTNLFLFRFCLEKRIQTSMNSKLQNGFTSLNINFFFIL